MHVFRVIFAYRNQLTSICHRLRYIDNFFPFFFFFFPLISYTRSVKIFRYRCCSHVAAFRPGYAYTNSICYLNSVKYLPFHEIRSAPLLLRKDIISLINFFLLFFFLFPFPLLISGCNDTFFFFLLLEALIFEHRYFKERYIA